MCFAAALPLASLAMSAGSSVAGFAAQSATADAQNRAYEANQVRALAAARDSQNALTTRQMQEADATNQRLGMLNVEQARRQAIAQVTGEKMGMGGGITLQNLTDDIGRRLDANRVAIITNGNNVAAQLQAEKDATNTLEQSRVNSMPQGVQPNVLGLLTSVGGAGAKFFGDQERAGRAGGDTYYGGGY